LNVFTFSGTEINQLSQNNSPERADIYGVRGCIN